MFVDSQLLFSDAQAITATAASSNVIDLGAAYRDVGIGEDLDLVVECDVAMTDVGSDSTVAVTLEQDTAAAFGSPTAIQTIGTFAALSAVGTRLRAKLPIGAITKRFLRLNYTVANGNLTTGSFTAFITKGVDASRAYADAVTIS